MKELLKAKSEFRKKGVTLIADKQKTGMGGSWRFAGEDNLIKTIQEPLTECGLEIVSTLRYMPELSTDTVVVTLYHVDSGESLEATASLRPITPRKDKNGNDMYLDAEIERGKQFGYLSRTLSIRLLGLSDIDPEDTQNRPDNLEEPNKYKDEVLAYLDKTAENDRISLEKWIKDTYKLKEVSDISSQNAMTILKSLEQRDASSK